MATMKHAAGGTVMTTFGHSITFAPDVSTYVPDIAEVITACRAAGAVDAEPETAPVAEATAKKGK